MLIFVASIVVTLAIIGLYILFYFLNKRVDSLYLQFQNFVLELKDKLTIVNDNLQTLRQNDDILAKDIENVLHEAKDIEKKVKLFKRS